MPRHVAHDPTPPGERFVKTRTLIKTIGCLFLLAAAPAFADPEPSYNRVDFQVEVGQDAANDQMNATLAIELTNANPGALAHELGDAMNDALKKSKAWPSVKASTGNQQSWPVYGTTVATRTTVQGWRGRAELRLESRDFKAAGELIAALQDKLQLSGINFSVAADTRRAADAALGKQAIAAFRTRADLIRDAWGAKSYKLINMNIGSVASNNPGPRPMMMYAKAMAADAAPAQDIAGGDAHMSMTINGTIELQP
jgi:predicted secreted protein